MNECKECENRKKKNKDFTTTMREVFKNILTATLRITGVILFAAAVIGTVYLRPDITPGALRFYDYTTIAAIVAAAFLLMAEVKA